VYGVAAPAPRQAVGARTAGAAPRRGLGIPSRAMVIHAVAARAWLGDPRSELLQARLRADDGDPDWRQWVDEYDRGEATLVDIEVSVTFGRSDGSTETVATVNHGIWLQVGVHPPVAAALVAEIAPKDFDYLAARIQELGEPVDVIELEQMYIDVALDESLLAALRPPAARPGSGPGPDFGPRLAPGADPRQWARPGITTENG